MVVGDQGSGREPTQDCADPWAVLTGSECGEAPDAAHIRRGLRADPRGQEQRVVGFVDEVLPIS